MNYSVFRDSDQLKVLKIGLVYIHETLIPFRSLYKTWKRPQLYYQKQ
jgi:hypothetical protein